MDVHEIRSLSIPEIKTQIDEAKKEMFNLRFQKASGQLQDSTRVKAVRREIARLLTIMREKQLAAELVMKEGRNA